MDKLNSVDSEKEPGFPISEIDGAPLSAVLLFKSFDSGDLVWKKPENCVIFEPRNSRVSLFRSVARWRSSEYPI